MRLHRFFIKEPIFSVGETVLSDERLAHQLRRVFRLHEGDKAIFFDGSGPDFVSEIVSMTKDTVTFRVLETAKATLHSRRRVALAVSLIKKDNFEWVIQKGTELGVSEFIPLVSDRSEKKGFNMERAEKIMIEACEQSGRGDVPTIREPQALEDFLATEKRKIIAFHTEGGTAFESLTDTSELVACIGPEGGWSENDMAMFKEKGAHVARLDSPILRAETAAIAIAALLLLS